MLPALRLLAANPGAALIRPAVLSGNLPPGNANRERGGLFMVISRIILSMDEHNQYTSWGIFLQEQKAIIDEMACKYQDVIKRLAVFLQEIPADLMLEADYIEAGPPNEMSHAEVVAYANGIRFAASTVVSAINAKMCFDRADMDGEWNAEQELDGDDNG